MMLPFSFQSLYFFIILFMTKLFNYNTPKLTLIFCVQCFVTFLPNPPGLNSADRQQLCITKLINGNFFNLLKNWSPGKRNLHYNSQQSTQKEL